MIEEEEQSIQSVGERMQAIHSTQLFTSSQVLLCTYPCVFHASDLQL